MANYVITLDTGTTNTRVILWDEQRNMVSTAKAEVGVRNTAIDGSNQRLKEAVKGCLEQALSEAGVSYEQVAIIIASGMITSNVGLVEIPHCVVPAGKKELAAAVRPVELPDVCPMPITFIPGVKNSGGAITYENFEAMDIMRGEEVESLALLEQFPKGRCYLLVLPGSHMKFVSVDEEGRITGCLTSISGELLASITHNTIIADAVGRKFVEPGQYDREKVLLGYETAKACGIGRACFSARILNQFAEKDQQKLANYILGAALQSDVTSVQNSTALHVSRDTEVIVAGKDPLRQAILDILRHENCFAHVHTAQTDDRSLSAQGAYLVAQALALV